MIDLIIIATLVGAYFVIAKNPIDRCCDTYKELRKDYKKNIFERIIDK